MLRLLGAFDGCQCGPGTRFSSGHAPRRHQQDCRRIARSGIRCGGKNRHRTAAPWQSPLQTASSATEWDRDAALTAARILLEIKAVNFRPEEAYTFTSGWKSPVYIDCRRIIYFPRARAKICDLAVEKIDRHVGYEVIETVAGGETAGIPFAAWIADRMGAPMSYVRKKPKGFGQNALIEGDVPVGKRTLLVEDLTTDGSRKFASPTRCATPGRS